MNLCSLLNLDTLLEMVVMSVPLMCPPLNDTSYNFTKQGTNGQKGIHSGKNPQQAKGSRCAYQLGYSLQMKRIESLSYETCQLADRYQLSNRTTPFGHLLSLFMGICHLAHKDLTRP